MQTGNPLIDLAGQMGGAIGEGLSGGYEGYQKGLEQKHGYLAGAAADAFKKAKVSGSLDDWKQVADLTNQALDIQNLRFGGTTPHYTPTEVNSLQPNYDAPAPSLADPTASKPGTPTSQYSPIAQPGQGAVGMTPLFPGTSTTTPGAFPALGAQRWQGQTPNLPATMTQPVDSGMTGLSKAAEPTLPQMSTIGQNPYDESTEAGRRNIARLRVMAGVPNPEITYHNGYGIQADPITGKPTIAIELPTVYNQNIANSNQTKRDIAGDKTDLGYYRVDSNNDTRRDIAHAGIEARAALEGFKQSEIGKRFYAGLQSKDYLHNVAKDPAAHYKNLAQAAKTLAGKPDDADVTGEAYAAKVNKIYEGLLQQAPLPAPQGGSPTGQAPFNQGVPTDYNDTALLPPVEKALQQGLAAFPGAQASSRARSVERNRAAGGAADSSHLHRVGFDIVPPAGQYDAMTKFYRDRGARVLGPNDPGGEPGHLHVDYRGMINNPAPAQAPTQPTASQPPAPQPASKPAPSRGLSTARGSATAGGVIKRLGLDASAGDTSAEDEF